MKIGVVGYGVVGKAAVNTLKRKFEIVKYDKYQDLDSFDNLLPCDFVFIMVPTPLIVIKMQLIYQQLMNL